MGTSGSVTSLQLVQRDGLLQNTANYAFVPWTIYILIYKISLWQPTLYLVGLDSEHRHIKLHPS